MTFQVIANNAILIAIVSYLVVFPKILSIVYALWAYVTSNNRRNIGLQTFAIDITFDEFKCLLGYKCNIFRNNCNVSSEMGYI